MIHRRISRRGGLTATVFLFVAIGAHAQTANIDPGARRGIEAGNQAWIDGMKQGAAAPIAATYAASAVDCAPNGECIRGRAAIEQHLRERIAKFGRARSASVTSMGSVQQGDFVYEWGRAEAAFAGGQKVAGRYLTVWQKQPDGSWMIFRNLALPDDTRR